MRRDEDPAIAPYDGSPAEAGRGLKPGLLADGSEIAEPET